MQRLIGQIYELSPFLANIPKNQHYDAVKHLIRLGLQTTRSYSFKENYSNESNSVKRELDIIKDNIQQLNQMFRQQSNHHCQGCDKGNLSQSKRQAVQTERKNNDQNSPLRKNKQNEHTSKKQDEKPKKDQKKEQKKAPARDNENSYNPFAKRKPFVSRHHLDDSAVREALEFPPQTFVQPEVHLKRHSQDYKKHIYQDEINKEQIGRIKREKGQSQDKERRDRTTSDYNRTTSKIKALLDKDKIRYEQKKRDHQFNEGFNQYEYSDQGYMEESSLEEDSRYVYDQDTFPRFNEENTYNQHYQSSFKPQQGSSSNKSRNRTSSKKDFERSGKQTRKQDEHRPSEESQKGQIKRHHAQNSDRRPKNIEYEEQEDDVVSNSSSFSQFSINESRKKDVGKISRRSQKD